MFPIEMFCYIFAEILLVLETKFQNSQVLTNKLMLPWPINWCLWAGISTRWYFRLVYCDFLSQNVGQESTSVWVLRLYGNWLKCWGWLQWHMQWSLFVGFTITWSTVKKVECKHWWSVWSIPELWILSQQL